MLLKDRDSLEKEYKKLGSQRTVAKKYNCSQRTVCKYMKELKIPAIPTMLHARGGNTGKGRLAELYFDGLPSLKKRKYQDQLATKGDKNHFDAVLNIDKKRVNVKCSHWERPSFRIKEKKHHCEYYVCAWFNDRISSMIPQRRWLIPANEVPLSTLTIGLKGKSRYDKFLLPVSLEDKKYNKSFARKYRKYLPTRRRRNNG